MVTTSLTIPQVQMILQIYWTDRYMRQSIGGDRSSRNLLTRIAKQFGVSVEVIKKVTALKDSANRERFPTIRVGDIKRRIRHRLRHHYGAEI